MTKILPNNIKIISAFFILSIILVLIFYISSSEYKKNNPIILPSDKNMEEIIDVQTDKNKNILTDIDINTNNVYSVISSLERPKEYSQTSEITLFFGEDNFVKKYESYTKNNFTRIDAYKQNGAIDFTNIIGDKDVYTFKNGENSYKKYIKADYLADDYGLIPTYEDINKDIIKTDIIDVLGEPCISVQTENEKYIISTISGLLIEAEYYKNNKIIRKVVVNNIKITDLDDNLFLLPGEMSLFN